jgi:hypothetical protein
MNDYIPAAIAMVIVFGVVWFIAYFMGAINAEG